MSLRDLMQKDLPGVPKVLMEGKNKKLIDLISRSNDDWVALKQALQAVKGPQEKAMKSLGAVTDMLYEMTAFTETDVKKAKAAEKFMEDCARIAKELKNL